MINLLEKKVEQFIRLHLNQKKLSKCLLPNYKHFDEIKEHVRFLFESLTGLGEMESVGNRLIAHLNEIEFEISTKSSLEMLSGSVGSTPLFPTKESFDYQIVHIIDHIAETMTEKGVRLDEEHFTNKEFEELKSKLSDIAESIFEFRNRQEAANEVIYNSVEEIRSELVKNAEKGRVLGKDFVIQQLAGKLIDMTVKGGAGAVLTKMSSQYSELSGKIMALM